MAKIPFDIKFRDKIESGEYKVETFSGYPVTIYRWDFDDGGQTPIMGSYVFEDGKEYVGAWNEEGHFDLMSPNDLDLFIITPDPELSEFENGLVNFYNKRCALTPDKDGAFNRHELDELLHKTAAELLELAKATALKDLPRWKKAVGYCFVGPSIMYDEHGFYHASITKPGCRYITGESLERLPGFNE